MNQECPVYNMFLLSLTVMLSYFLLVVSGSPSKPAVSVVKEAHQEQTRLRKFASSLSTHFDAVKSVLSNTLDQMPSPLTNTSHTSFLTYLPFEASHA